MAQHASNAEIIFAGWIDAIRRSVHIQDYARRQDTLVAAGAAERGGWQ